MKSMTGYGRGECSQDGFKVTVELSSVNRKQSEITVYLPRNFEALESRIREAINQRVARGKVTARVSTHEADGSAAARVHFNEALAEAYAKQFRKLATRLGLEQGVTLEALLRAPGVLQTDEELADSEALWPSVEKALKKGLDGLVQMRTREGTHLKTDLKERVAILRKSTALIQKHAPRAVERYREQLRERIAAAGLETPPPDDERLIKEVVYFADRSDITEELTRLQSHFKQFEECMASDQPVGRTLDFLAQEMHREVNTIGSKANDPVIAREVVNAKAELERFREQAQNVE